jgi:chromosome partitioning protein
MDPAALVLNGCPAGRGGTESALTVEARAALASYGLPVAPVAVATRAALSHASDRRASRHRI